MGQSIRDVVTFILLMWKNYSCGGNGRGLSPPVIVDIWICAFQGCCFLDVNQLRGGKRHDMWLQLSGVKTGQIHVAATVVDINSQISMDYYEDGGSSSAGDTTMCPCICERDSCILLNDSIALHSKMKQVKPEHHHHHHTDDSTTSASTSNRPKIKHVRVASVDSDRFEGVFDAKGNPTLERESLMFQNGSSLSASIATTADMRASTSLPSVAEKASTQSWEADNVIPGKARKRRTFMFLRPRATTPTTTAGPSLEGKQINNRSSPSKTHHRINLKALYKRVSSEFRSAQDPAASLFEVPIVGCHSHYVGDEETPKMPPND